MAREHVFLGSAERYSIGDVARLAVLEELVESRRDAVV